MNEIDDFKARAHRWAERAGIKAEPERIEGMYRIIEYRMKRSGKDCPRCGERKPLSAFGVNLSRDDALAAYCKECEAARLRERRANKG